VADDKTFPTLTELFLKTPLYEAVNLSNPTADFRRRETLERVDAELARARIAQAAVLDSDLGTPSPPETKEARSHRIAAINLESVRDYSGPLDAYCLGCGAPSIFTHTRSRSGASHMADNSVFNSAHFSKDFSCTRQSSHRLHFNFSHDGKEQTITKIGQLPSLADLSLPDAQRYRRILGEARYKEFAKAIGLAAHGIGIGSFVYLRRIFERLIDDAREAAKTDEHWNDADYPLRIEDRIKALRAYLPDFLVENRGLYSILSVGLHELTEDDCLAYFPVVKNGIELILDEKIVEQERAAKIKASQSAIGALTGKLRKESASPPDKS
jgi:hypothetical protein